MPLPFSLVVKNGSKRWPFTSSLMPWPESRTVSTTHGPGPRSGPTAGSSAASSTAAVSRHEPAARGHGVPRVHREVDDDLLDLVGIGAHRAGARGEGDHQLDVLADQRAQQLLRGGHDVVEVEHLGPQDLLAAEGEQALGEGRRAPDGAADLAEVGERGGVGRERVGRAGRRSPR